MRAVLTHLKQHNLFVKLEKCEFHRETITFMGYVLSPNGVEMDQTKVKAVTEWPKPTTVKELQHFLGFANFYWRFIRNYSTIAGPWPSLLKGKPKKLSSSESACETFERLKQAPILSP